MILVTGAAGFIGSYLAREILAESGPQGLIACDTQEAWNSTRCARKVRESGVRFVDLEGLDAWLGSSGDRLKGILHMGASSRTDELREDYLERVNVQASQKLWEEARRRQIPFVYASSGATYGAGEQGFSDAPEKAPALKPTNPYGWSKQRFDLWVLDEVKAGRTPPQWAGLKFFNVYGPGEDHKGSQASMVYHSRLQFESQGFVKLFRSEKPEYRDGEQMRDFVFVGDCARVARAALAGQVKSGIYNVGTGRAQTWIELVKAVAKGLECPARWEFIPLPEKLRSHYQYYTQAELTRLRSAGYTEAFVDLEEGARRTFAEEARLV